MEPKPDSNHSSFFVRLQTSLRHRFIAGLLVVVPLWLTYIALRFFFRILDGFFAPLVKRSFGFSVPGLGFILLLAFIYLIGMITSNILGRSLVHFWESILTRIPFVKNIYHGAKQLIHTLSLSKNSGFKRVVFVEFPRPGLLAIGFVTSSVQDQANGKRLIGVFIPHTPSPTSGMLEFVPESDIIETRLTIEEGIKMVISGGIVSPPTLAFRSEGTKPSS